MPKSTGEHWLGAPGAASYLGVGLRVVYKLIDRGHIRAYKLGRVTRMRREDVDAFLEQNRIQPGIIGHLWRIPGEQATSASDAAPVGRRRAARAERDPHDG